ncbi:putative phage abortive infection protein [Acinetobacter tandoii]|uniref:putative phage abortive infection protein n=1 Tax=Acinetobacter tandoii TaxID=202954 RepID=UPI003016029A
MTNHHSKEKTTPDSYELDKIDSDITNHRLRAFLIIILVGVLYLYLGDKKLPESAQSWGTFGDFIGGILNPIFALFAFYWLTYSVRLQIKELKDTRIELQKAADAQVETAQHQENIAKLEEENVKTQQEILTLQKTSLDKQIESTGLQQRQIELQNFESLFFELLKTKAVALDNILYEEIFINDNFCANTNPDISHGILSGPTPYRSIDAVKKHINAFKIKHKEEWKDYYKNYLLGYMGSYFRICYQIVKLIDQNPTLRKASPVFRKKYSIDQKKYFDIFRSTLSQYELEAFFFNCLSPYGNKKFKKLIEKYGLLEPLLIDTSSSNTAIHPLTKYAYRYDRKIFEESPDWNDYFEDMNRISLDTNPKIIVKHANYLEKLITEINFNQEIKETNGFDIIKNKFNELKEVYSEEFKDINNPHKLSRNSEKFQQYNQLNILKQVPFTHEIYIILKYNIDYLAYYDYVSKQQKIADPE